MKFKGEENEGTQRKMQIVKKQDTANVPGTTERLLCRAQTLLASNASSCRTPIRLHTCHGSQLHLPFHQPVLDIFSKYYFAGFFPSLFVKSTVITIRMHQIIEPMELTAGEMNICVPPETPTGCSSAGSQPLSMNHRVRCPHPTEPGTH